MSGYLYPYTPYPTAGNLQSSGQAFLGGFGAGQELESRAQEMDARNQLQKLRQIEEERQAQAFPLRMQQAEQQLKFAAQTQPLSLEGLRLRNQQIQANLALTAQQRAAAAALARMYSTEGAGAGAIPSPTTPQPATPPSVTPPAQGYPGLLAPFSPNAPAATPGPQSSAAPSWLSAGFGDRRFTGMQLASAGMSDYTGLPTGMAEPDFQAYPQTGYADGSQEGPSPTAPGALPAAMLPPEQRAGAVAPVETPERPIYAGRPISQMSDRELADIVRASIPGGGGPAAAGLAVLPPDQREVLISEARLALSMRRAQQNPDYAQYRGVPEEQYGVFPGEGATTPVPPGAAPVSATTPSVTAARGVTVAPTESVPPITTEARASTEGGPAGLRPQGAPTQQQVSNDISRRLSELTTEAPDPLSPMDPYRVGVESRALDNEERNIQVARRRLDVTRREAALLAQSGNTAGAMTLMANVRNAEADLEARSSALALQRANLNGRINTSEFAAGNFGPMANDIFQASGGRLRLQPVAGTDRFNLIGPDGSIRGTRTQQELISDGRSLYDTNYQSQITAIRERRIKRSDDIFKATVDALEQSLKDTSTTTREIAVKEAEKRAEAMYRGSDIRVTVDQQSGTIIFQDSRGIVPRRILRVVPARDIRGREIPGQFTTQEVEAQTRPTQ